MKKPLPRNQVISTTINTPSIFSRIPVLIMVAIRILSVPNMIALGGVAVGSIKARDEARVAGIMNRMGLFPLVTARLANTGSSICVDATLEVSSVRNDMRVTMQKRISSGWTLRVQASCSPNHRARPLDWNPAASAKPTGPGSCAG